MIFFFRDIMVCSFHEVLHKFGIDVSMYYKWRWVLHDESFMCTQCRQCIDWWKKNVHYTKCANFSSILEDSRIPQPQFLGPLKDKSTSCSSHAFFKFHTNFPFGRVVRKDRFLYGFSCGFCLCNYYPLILNVLSDNQGL